jgi:hypothetical protein
VELSVEVVLMDRMLLKGDDIVTVPGGVSL